MVAGEEIGVYSLGSKFRIFRKKSEIIIVYNIHCALPGIDRGIGKCNDLSDAFIGGLNQIIPDQIV